MNLYAYINPQLFADEGAAAAPAGGGAETGTAAESGTEVQTVNVGDTLSDGSQVQDPQVAAAMNKRLKQHPELREAFFGQRAQTQQEPEMPQQAQAEPTPEEWAEAKKRFARFYGEDVGNAVKDRFKNHDDLQAKLDAMQPMLNVLKKKTGAESDEELQNLIMDDDSLYEDEAEEMGMPVEQYKKFKKLQDEHDQIVAREQQRQEQEMLRQHVAGIRQQAEELQKAFPNFNLEAEMQNPEFIKLTQPGGISVKQAYMALHGDELIPQMMAYGMQRAQQQMGQTIQAQRARPAEGAMSGKNPAAAEPRINPKNLSRPEMKKYKELIRMGKFTSFDR